MDSINYTTNEDLTTFLRQLATDIEQSAILDYQLQSIGEFYMSHTLKNEIYEINKNDELDNKEHTDDEFDPDEVMKFVTLGWWIYTHILKDKVVEENL